MNQADIDIDLPVKFKPEEIFPNWVRAMIHDKDNHRPKPHPCGYYPQLIPKDPISGLSAIPYDTAEALGYTKIDFLHLSIYDHFSSRNEIKELLAIEPEWQLLKSPGVVKMLFQLANHFDVVSQVSPTSTQELADTLALIRPGKRNLIGLYLKNKESTRKILYSQTGDEYSFKKAHAISYALVIQLQLHLISLGFSF